MENDKKTWEKKHLILEKSCLFLNLPFYLLFLLYIAWPWAPLWHDDMLSTLMVYDGIKALSGGHRRCSEPRPWVALDGRGAVISVPHCQSWPPPPSLKNLSICHISRGRPSARHVLSCHHRRTVAHPASGHAGVFTKKNNHNNLSITVLLIKVYMPKNVGVVFPSWSNYNSAFRPKEFCLLPSTEPNFFHFNLQHVYVS